MRPGDRLPSARALAVQLRVARGTVDAAYELLQGEGYIIARRPSGSIVSPALKIKRDARGFKPRDLLPLAAKPHERLANRKPTPDIQRPFQIGLPAFDMFPRKLWSRTATRCARSFTAGDMNYPDPRGHLPLREAIASYVTISRGITCDPEEVLVTNGYQGALDLVAHTLLRSGDMAWFEDPGYFRARAVLEAAGINIVPIPVDGLGLNVQEGLRRAPRARAAIVTPAHQQPLGVALSLERRIELLSWAKSVGAWIVEDDYDGEFHYIGRPLSALKSLDRYGRVIYAGSFSKVLFPSLRLGYLIVPESVVRILTDANHLRMASLPIFNQAVVASFMIEGHFARHLKRMRDLYTTRRTSLARALSKVFGDRISVELRPGGMHLIARVCSSHRDVDLAQLAMENGFAVGALSSHAIAKSGGQGLLLGFTNISEADALENCQRLERLIGKRLAVHSN